MTAGALHYQAPPPPSSGSEISHSYVSEEEASDVSSLFLISSDWIFEKDHDDHDDHAQVEDDSTPNKSKHTKSNSVSSIKDSFLTLVHSGNTDQQETDDLGKTFQWLELEESPTSFRKTEDTSTVLTHDEDDEETNSLSTAASSDNSITTGNCIQRPRLYRKILSLKAQQAVLDARNAVQTAADDAQRSVASLSSEASEQARLAAFLASHLLTSITSSKAEYKETATAKRTSSKQEEMERSDRHLHDGKTKRRVSVNPTIVIERPKDSIRNGNSYTKNSKSRYSKAAAKQLQRPESPTTSRQAMVSLYSSSKMDHQSVPVNSKSNNEKEEDSNKVAVCDDLMIEVCTEIGDQARLAMHFISSLFGSSEPSKDNNNDDMTSSPTEGVVQLPEEDVVVLPAPRVHIPKVVRKGHILPKLLQTGSLQRETGIVKPRRKYGKKKSSKATTDDNFDFDRRSSQASTDDVFDFADADSAILDDSSFPVVKRVKFDESTFAQWV
jgi:hypothetical protein